MGFTIPIKNGRIKRFNHSSKKWIHKEVSISRLFFQFYQVEIDLYIAFNYNNANLIKGEIKMDRKEFANLRKEIIGESCKEVYKRAKEYDKVRDWIKSMNTVASKGELEDSLHRDYINATMYLS